MSEVAGIENTPAPAAAAGWHPCPYSPNAGLLRYYDGAKWTQQTQPMAPLAATPQAPQYPIAAPAQPIVNVAVAVGGGRKAHHLLHFIMTVITAGLWLPIWIFCAIRAGRGGATAVNR